jgi:hypothetical protein
VAVTQQIARLTQEELSRCRESIETLHRLCSFELRDPWDYLDLDWSPVPLERLAEEVGPNLRAAIRQACSGGDEINPAYREAARSVFEHPVRALEPRAVVDVAATLSANAPSVLVNVLPSAPEAARQMVGMPDFHGHPGDYLRGHYASLRRFYMEAAASEHATATWWD